MAHLFLSIMAARWKDHEFRELLSICGKEEIRRQTSGTVRDSDLAPLTMLNENQTIYTRPWKRRTQTAGAKLGSVLTENVTTLLWHRWKHFLKALRQIQWNRIISHGTPSISPSALVCHDSQGSTAHNGGNKGLLPLPVASTIRLATNSTCLRRISAPTLLNLWVCLLWKRKKNAKHKTTMLTIVSLMSILSTVYLAGLRRT